MDNFVPIKKSLKDLINSKTLSDVKFLVGKEGKKMYGHKVILAMNSQLFQNIFYSKQKWKETSNKKTQVDLSDIKPHVFLYILEYCYTRQISGTNLPLFDLLFTSNKFQIKELSNYCFKEIEKTLTPEMCLEYLDQITRAYENDFVEYFLKYFERNSKKCLRISGCLNSISIMTLNLIFSSNNLLIPEIELITRLIERSKSLNVIPDGIFQKINYRLINVDQLLELASSTLFTTNEYAEKSLFNYFIQFLNSNTNNTTGTGTTATTKVNKDKNIHNNNSNSFNKNKNNSKDNNKDNNNNNNNHSNNNNNNNNNNDQKFQKLKNIKEHKKEILKDINQYLLETKKKPTQLQKVERENVTKIPKRFNEFKEFPQQNSRKKRKAPSEITVAFLVSSKSEKHISDVTDSITVSGIRKIKKFDVSDLYGSVPPYEVLIKFDVIFFFSAIPLSNPDKLGDILARCIIAGRGLVICSIFALSKKEYSKISGKIVTGGFLPFDLNVRNYLVPLKSDENLVISKHPVLENVNETFDGGSGSFHIHTLGTPLKNSNVIAKWENGNILIAEKRLKPSFGNVIALNLYPVSDGIFNFEYLNDTDYNRYAKTPNFPIKGRYFFPTISSRRIIANSIYYAAVD
ncbi:pep-cterm sorting domain-containing protein [Anaeramoeba flamelloides]|uniref:Pep-cterm sorting domain-containing protein n=1 Tax=Anaeramoeba flamelloides TaxID=1746091 RepID=A0ABQ8YIR1_9EUKA|nr:pep-cterm sorting domain-containing protein [Anaeramoeba flamelloides]